jgi:hypothetical protein
MNIQCIICAAFYCVLSATLVGCGSARNGKAEISNDETGMEMASLSADFTSYGGPCTGPTMPVEYSAQDIIKYPKRVGLISGSEVSIANIANAKLVGTIFIEEFSMKIDLRIPDLDQSGKVSGYSAYRFNGKYDRTKGATPP